MGVTKVACRFFMIGIVLTSGVVVARNYGVALNHLQVLGTHNSYRIRPDAQYMKALARFDEELANSLDYTHVPFEEQWITYGVRHIELDVFADPQGGLYKKRRGLSVIGRDPNSGLKELDTPGYKVLHVQDIDFLSHCLTLVSCLQKIKKWSIKHPDHIPLAVQIEFKDELISDPLELGFTIPYRSDARVLQDLDNEIISVLPKSMLITPDWVRGNGSTLESKILNDGWPLLKDCRGKIFFHLGNKGRVRDLYIKGHASLRKRVMFTNSLPGTAEAAILLRENPTAANLEDIQGLVRKGYLVRIRADSNTLEARSGSTERRDLALASGAHFISTDYLKKDLRYQTDYFVSIPQGNPGRCNPISSNNRQCYPSKISELMVE